MFLVGFTLGPAGLFALGWLVALIGFVLVAAGLVGFRSIKEPATQDSLDVEHKRTAAMARTGAH
jgi:hypothetical protein